MSIFKKKKGTLKILNRYEKDGVSSTLYVDANNVDSSHIREDIIVAILVPSIDGMLHYSILQLWTQVVLKVGYLIYVGAENTYLNYSRNKLVDNANQIAAEGLNKLPDYYLFLDQDSVVRPDLFDKLKAKLDKHKIDIVSADYIRKTGWNPVWTPAEYFTTWHEKWKYKRGDLIEIVTTGAGALLVKGDVLRKIDPPWFKVESDNRAFIGEDSYFCRLCRKHGYKVYVATDITIGHKGAVVYPSDWEQRHRKLRPPGQGGDTDG